MEVIIQAPVAHLFTSIKYVVERKEPCSRGDFLHRDSCCGIFIIIMAIMAADSDWLCDIVFSGSCKQSVHVTAFNASLPSHMYMLHVWHWCGCASLGLWVYVCGKAQWVTRMCVWGSGWVGVWVWDATGTRNVCECSRWECVFVGDVVGRSVWEQGWASVCDVCMCVCVHV